MTFHPNANKRLGGKPSSLVERAIKVIEDLKDSFSRITVLREIFYKLA